MDNKIKLICMLVLDDNPGASCNPKPYQPENKFAIENFFLSGSISYG
jgi:hypothetical protein